MRGANKVWPGFLNWQTDEYFASVAPEEPFIVSTQSIDDLTYQHTAA